MSRPASGDDQILMNAREAIASVGIPVDRDRSFRFVVTGDSGLS